jgi:restriction system protein
MKEFYRVMLGRGSMYAQECREQGFIGASFDIHQDLTNSLPENWREFNQQFIPIYLEANPGKSKIAAGLSCGFLWTICKGIKTGDIVLSPDGKGKYFAGEVQSDYRYAPGAKQPHQRQVHWFDETIDRSEMSDSLKNSTGSIGTISQISKYRTELESLIKGEAPKPVLIDTSEIIEDPTVFALEKHLEDFLVKNWIQTPLGKEYDIYQDEDNSGQQFPTDTGPIDILAVSKDKQEVLVVELKKGRASDSVVGQIQRYMGYIAEEIAEEHQRVKGVIIALEDDLRIKRALKVAQNIDFYKYEVKFDLIKN